MNRGAIFPRGVDPFDGVGEPSPQYKAAVAAETVHLRSARVLESRAYARKLRAVAKLCADADAEGLLHSSDGMAAVEALIGAALGESTWVTSRLMGLAETADHLPSVLDGLYSGTLTPRLADAVLRRCDLVLDDAVWLELDLLLGGYFERRGTWSVRRIQAAVDRALAMLDPDSVRHDPEKPPRREEVDVMPAGRDWLTLAATLPAVDVEVLDKRLTELADTCCDNDPRPTSQRKAIALRDAVLGKMIACACERSDCTQPAAEIPTTTVQLVVHAFAAAETMAENSTGVAVTDTGTVLTGESLRKAATRWPTRTTPFVPTADATQPANPYLPTAATRTLIRLRDLWCTFPGCNNPATRSDIDHTVEYNHSNPTAGGHTHPHNLKVLCRFHHLVKTHTWWLDDQTGNGGDSIIFTSVGGTDFYGPAFDGRDLITEIEQITPRDKLADKHRRRQRERRKNRARRIAAEELNGPPPF